MSVTAVKPRSSDHGSNSRAAHNAPADPVRDLADPTRCDVDDAGLLLVLSPLAGEPGGDAASTEREGVGGVVTVTCAPASTATHRTISAGGTIPAFAYQTAPVSLSPTFARFFNAGHASQHNSPESHTLWPIRKHNAAEFFSPARQRHPVILGASIRCSARSHKSQ